MMVWWMTCYHFLRVIFNSLKTNGLLIKSVPRELPIINIIISVRTYAWRADFHQNQHKHLKDRQFWRSKTKFFVTIFICDTISKLESYCANTLLKTSCQPFLNLTNNTLIFCIVKAIIFGCVGAHHLQHKYIRWDILFETKKTLKFVSKHWKLFQDDGIWSFVFIKGLSLSIKINKILLNFEYFLQLMSLLAITRLHAQSQSGFSFACVCFNAWWIYANTFK